MTMPGERRRVLAIAVAYGKMASVLLIDGRLKDWQCSREAGLAVTKGRSFLRLAVQRYSPDLVIIENPHGPTRKSGIARSVLYALAQELEDSGTAHLLVRRIQPFANKYEEARALAQRFPEIKPWLPHTPKIWDSEPIETIYFEALSMAVAVLDD
jgi:hypothetical protein